jgi:1,4-dihydroxy-2-naphthoate octaprenyltransferase
MTQVRGGWAIWWESARPKTLPAAIAPVMLASSLAWSDGGFKANAALTCLLFSVLVQIGTNYANDYFDFIKGADTADRVGPRRAVAAGLIPPPTMKKAMIGVFTIAFIVGLTLLRFGGWPLLVVGIASIICGILYTGGPYPFAYHGWGDVFVFIFFGLVAVTTTYFVQCGIISSEAWLIGAGIGGLATNILVVNNYRDVETDRAAGKRTLVVRWGRKFARIQFLLAHLLMIFVTLILGHRGFLSEVVTIIVTLFLIANAVGQAKRLARADSPAELIKLLGTTGRHVAMSSILMSAGLIWSKLT